MRDIFKSSKHFIILFVSSIFLFALLLLLRDLVKFNSDYVNDNAQRIIDVSKAESVKINKYLSFHSTNDVSLSISILNRAFKYTNSKRISINDDAKYLWAKVILENPTDKPLTRYFYLDNNLVGNIEFYKVQGPILKRIYKKNNEIPSHIANIEVTIQPNSYFILLFRKEMNFALISDAYISTMENFLYFNSKRNVPLYYFSGVSLIALCFGFIIYFYFRKMRILVLLSYMALATITLLSYAGVFAEYEKVKDTIFYHSYYTIMLFDLITAIVILRPKTLPLNFKATLYSVSLINFIYYLYAMIWHEVNINRTYLLTHLGLSMFLSFFILLGYIYKYLRGEKVNVFYGASWSFLFVPVLLFISYLHFDNLSFYHFTAITVLAVFFKVLLLQVALFYEDILIQNSLIISKIKRAEKDRFRQLLRVLSHDIANSLLLISLTSKRLKRTSKKESELKEVERLIRATNSINAILERTKLNEKIVSDLSHIQLTKIDLKQMINDCFFIFEEHLLKKNLIVNTDISEDSQYVYADEITLKNNVLSNIFSNAIKYSREGSSIDIKSRKDALGRIQITIKDSGNGFSNTILDFFNADERQKTVIEEKKNFQGTYSHNKMDEIRMGVRLIKAYMSIYNGRIKAFNKDGAIIQLYFVP